jgi:putative nucleotidyltransferase with HDIG domain
MSHTFSTFQELRVAGFSVDALWSHSTLVGAFARRIAQAEGSDEPTVEASFAAGLLHDFGKLLIGANQPDVFTQILAHAKKDGTSFSEAESKVFANYGHAEIGACLLGIWWLPQAVVESVAFHHHPSQLAAAGFTPATAVHAADVFAHETQSDGLGITAPQLDASYIASLGLESRVAEWRKECAAAKG